LIVSDSILHGTVETAALSINRGAVVPVALHWEAWDQKAKEES
jgi:hypothetical protein